MPQVVRIARLVGMTRRKLGGNGLAEDPAAGFAHLRHARRITRRPVTAVDWRTVLGRHVAGVDYVFHADRNAVQPALRRLAVALPRLLQREFRVDEGPGANRVLALLDAFQTRRN